MVVTDSINGELVLLWLQFNPSDRAHVIQIAKVILSGLGYLHLRAANVGIGFGGF
jgi:hypothetical protein